MKRSVEQIEAMVPNNIDVEQALLGSVLIDPEAFIIVSDIIVADDFYRDAHRSIFEAMTYLVDRQEAPDIISVSDELARKNIELSPGKDNFACLQGLTSLVPTSGNAETYAHIVEDASIRRRLIHTAGLIAASGQHDNADDALATAEELVLSISQRRNKSSFSKISDVMSKCMTRLEQVSKNHSMVVGVPSGFDDLDKLTKGFRKQALYILAARPAMGKSSMMLNIAYHATKQGYKTAVFSLEMSEEELGYRLISGRAGVDSMKLQTGWLEDEDWSRAIFAMSEIAESSMVIDDTGGLSITQLCSRLRQIKAKSGLDFVVVDYLQLLTANKQGKRIDNRVLELGEISRALKTVAKELDVPVLALAQLSRAVENRQSKIPQLSDLRESGSIENDADCVMFIYRDEVYNPDSERKGLADLIVAKHRNGPTGEITLKWIAEQTKFGNLEIMPSEETL